MICICLTQNSLNENYDIIKKYENTADLFELRYDLLAENEILKPITNFTEKPVIFTIRLIEDGGGRDIQANIFLQKYKEAIENNFSFLDIHVPQNDNTFFTEDNISNLLSAAEKKNIKIIRSIHYMDNQPENLHDIFKKITDSAGNIAKLAVKPSKTIDLLRLFQLADDFSSNEKIIIGMGDYGFPTRVLTKRLGSKWTYCSPQNSVSAAPGHVTPEMLNNIYRYNEINANDEIQCVIGNPIMHSKSPEIHNAVLKKHQISKVYVPVTVDIIEDFFTFSDYLGINNVSVTVPYKEEVIEACTYIADEVKFTGACNTLIRKKDGWYGFNTDIEGFMKPFRAFMNNKPLSGYKITVIGAGGGAKGVAYGLNKDGADILIVNRTLSRAKELAEKLNAKAEILSKDNYDVLSDYNDAFVQTTNCGMLNFEEKDPLEDYNYTGAEKLFDIVYNPPETKIMKRAKQFGCKTVNGDTMLLEQAKIQYLLFNDREYDS